MEHKRNVKNKVQYLELARHVANGETCYLNGNAEAISTRDKMERVVKEAYRIEKSLRCCCMVLYMYGPGHTI